MSVKIKGINRSLVLVFEEGNLNDYLLYLEDKFNENTQLFKGSRVVFKGDGLDRLTPEEIAVLQQLCLEKGMILNNWETESLSDKICDNNKHAFLHKYLRSGQKVRSEGSIVIWGDVHESAEIIAAGDIIVLGRLEGIAHAGYYGDMNSIVFALSLSPRQIRIGNQISRASGDNQKRSYPEIAYWEDDSICIKEYNPRDLFK